MLVRKNMITIFELNENDGKKIGIQYPISEYEEAMINSLPNIEFRKKLKCWSLPYTKRDYNNLRNLALPIQVLSSTGTIDDLPSKNVHSGISTMSGTQQIQQVDHSVVPSVGERRTDADINIKDAYYKTTLSWNGNIFKINTPYTKTDVDFLKSLRGCYWNSKIKAWLCTASLENLNKLHDHFSIWSNQEFEKIFELISLQHDPKIITLFITPQYKESVMVKVHGYKMDIEFLKKIPNRKYDKTFKRWQIPRNNLIINRIIEYYENQGVRIINRIPKHNAEYQKTIPKNQQQLERLIRKCKVEDRPVIQKFSEMLLRQQYSWKTIASYCYKLTGLMDFYRPRPLINLKIEDIHYYLAHLAKKDASNSLLNVVFSAIKLYYEKVEYVPAFNIEKLKRPKKRRYLPTILSIGEVDRMLRSVKNMKHLTVLYTIYGGGLRLNEIIHLRVQDIQWDRNQLKIIQGKGKKERMVMLSQTLKQLLEKYFNEYKPQYWLFEGKDNKSQYSPRSIQQIVKRAAKAAHISRRVTPHTLRHCFATHLLDHGTDIRYIQELLGHRDIKTTLIYTHVTTRSMQQIQSPLDKMRGVE